MIRVGPFILQEPIGRGGMAEVWGAVHERQGEPAAVKILTGEAILNPVYLALFRKEVRGIAGLDHPHIVKIFDHGLLSPAAADASGGTLQAGSPWLAMERLDGGTLSDYARDGVDWEHLSAALLATLDGLASRALDLTIRVGRQGRRPAWNWSAIPPRTVRRISCRVGRSGPGWIISPIATPIAACR